MNISKTLFTVSAGLAAAAPAAAHDGDHSIGFASTALHWLSSPTHALFAIIGSAALTALVVTIARKKA